MKPSTLPVTSAWPSGVKRATSGWLFFPNLIARSKSVGKRSTSSRAPAAWPRNRSNAVPGGSRPWCCCLRARAAAAPRPSGHGAWTAMARLGGRLLDIRCGFCACSWSASASHAWLAAACQACRDTCSCSNGRQPDRRAMRTMQTLHTTASTQAPG